MDFRITAEEEALAFRLAELDVKGRLLVREATDGVIVLDLNGPAWKAAGKAAHRSAPDLRRPWRLTDAIP
ncbi:hypothetical protein [Streptomyces arenae]|uniref:hypothetical protein n=1 Tax=Streptomyces arenae TaxID=29301 RepID=UPI0026590B2C|nr:hypothetical protein [Streptomyces arenae]MCG7205210.1 hypothetical protein [Streptomyces arenae]